MLGSSEYIWGVSFSPQVRAGGFPGQSAIDLEQMLTDVTVVPFVHIVIVYLLQADFFPVG